MPISEADTKLVVGLIREARRKTDGSIPKMVEWLALRKDFMVDEQRHHFESAIEIIAMDEEFAIVKPLVVPGPELKAGMVVEVKSDLNVRLTRDSYIDPADKKLTIDGIRLDNNEPWCACVEEKSSYFVIPPTRALVNDPGFGLAF